MRLGRAQKLLPWAPLAIRLSMGVIFLAHGAQQLFGIWDGPGLPEPIAISKAAARIPAYLSLIAAGANRYLVKPLNLRGFLQILDEALSERKV